MQSLPKTANRFAEEEAKLNAKERKRNADAVWPEPPKPEPTLEETGALLVKDAEEDDGLSKVQHCLEVMAGYNDEPPSPVVCYARHQWHVMAGGIKIYIPTGMSREEVADSLKEARRLLVTYWGPMLQDPEKLTAMIYDVKIKHAKREAKRKPRKVIEDKPYTWPAERHKAAEQALQMVGELFLMKAPQDEREAWINHWLKNRDDLRRDALAFAKLALAEIEAGTAFGAKRKAVSK